MHFAQRLTHAALALAIGAAATAPAFAEPKGVPPPGGKYHDCQGYIRHISVANMRVHCENGRPYDISFLSWPKFTMPDGRTVNQKDLKPGTRVHLVFTQSLGIRHVQKAFVVSGGRGVNELRN